MTPDLYGPKYQKKVVAFFDQLLDPKFAGKPFMRHYLDYYFDIYWDLHLGVKGEAIPAEVRQIGESFNTVLAYRNPTRQIVYENYMKVRQLLDPLKEWIDERVKELQSGRTPDPDKTIAWYWLKNAGNGEHFSRKDIVFEVFHNFVALSQWGNTIFGIMSRLSKHGGDAEVQALFMKTMSGDYDHASGGPFTPVQLFVMELFRTISPNGGSLSAIEDAPRSFYGQSPHTLLDARFKRYGYMNTPHTSTSFDPVHWSNPQQFDPDRYKNVPTSDQIDEAKCKQMGFARCPFDITSFHVVDGRKASLTNSGFGAVFGVADGKPLPVVDYAGFLRLPALPGRAAHDPGVRGLPAEGVEGQDQVCEAQSAEPRPGPDRADRRHRGRHRIHQKRVRTPRVDRRAKEIRPPPANGADFNDADDAPPRSIRASAAEPRRPQPGPSDGTYWPCAGGGSYVTPSLSSVWRPRRRRREPRSGRGRRSAKGQLRRRSQSQLTSSALCISLTSLSLLSS